MFSGFSLWQILIVCGGVFLGSVVDAIGGGGGLITLPSFLLAGLPVHSAIATNKMASAIGTTASTGRYLLRGYVSWKTVLPAIVLAAVGSHFGAELQLAVDEKYSRYLLIAVLVVVAFVMLKDKSFAPSGAKSPGWQFFFVLLFSLIVGTYDGFYGPGAGTFLLLAYCKLARMELTDASGTVKAVNLASNIGAFITMLIAGKVIVPLGIAAGIFGFLGHWLGAGLMIKNGRKIVRPIVLTVLVLLFTKILSEV